METKAHYSIGRAVIPQRLINKTVTYNDIVGVVSEYTGISHAQMCVRTRQRTIVNTRYYCYYLIHKHTKMTLQGMGGIFGSYDHVTVMHGIQKVSDLMDVYPKVAKDIDTINKQIIIKYLL